MFQLNQINIVDIAFTDLVFVPENIIKQLFRCYYDNVC